jgi:hypothetical protein
MITVSPEVIVFRKKKDVKLAKALALFHYMETNPNVAGADDWVYKYWRDFLEHAVQLNWAIGQVEVLAFDTDPDLDPDTFNIFNQPTQG